MKTNQLFISLATGIFFFLSCKKDNPPSPPQILTETLSGVISSDLSLDANKTYLLKGRVFVKNNATLTIPAGVKVAVEKSDQPSLKGALIISKGAKLNVNGTAELPVIFTSAASSKSPGDWIGIILLGKAPVNYLNAHIKGFEESTDTEFGGSVPDDNSGSLKYLRVEYAGGLNPLKEDEWELDMASGLSLESVGSATSIDHIIVSNSRDDGFQFVGGTVNAKYLIGYKNGDDDFDFDRGYIGKLQFLISYRTAPSEFAIRANGMESLNDKDASSATPYTRPVISNMTIIGPQGIEADLTDQSQGVYIRKNTRFSIFNSIISGYSNGGLMLCTRTKPILINDAGSVFKFNLVNADDNNRTFVFDKDGTGTNIVPDPEVAKYAIESTVADIEKQALNNNLIINSIPDLGLKAVYAEVPDLSVSVQSISSTGANFQSADYSSFFTVVSFKGAVGSDNWAAKSNWNTWK